MKTTNSKLLSFAILIMTVIACGSSQQTHKDPTSPQSANPASSPKPTTSSNANFDLSTSNPIPPADILEEVTYYGQGAGNCPKTSYPIPEIVGVTGDTILMMESTLSACGWEENEVLTGNVIYPNGRTFVYSVKTYKDFNGVGGTLRFTPSINDPVGPYKLVLIGQYGSVEATIYYSKPKGPHIFYADENEIYLYGFSSSEEITLYCYDSTGQIKDGDFVGVFLGWKEYKVDADGTLTINAPTNKCNFAVIGKKSGEVHLLRNLAGGGFYDWAPKTIRTQNNSSTASEQTTSCPGAPEQRLEIGKMAYVCTSIDSVKLREGPGKDYTVIRSLIPGADLEIIGGPECKNNWSWWQVKTESGYVGWMSEGGDSKDKYFLCPAK